MKKTVNDMQKKGKIYLKKNYREGRHIEKKNFFFK